MPNIKLTCPAAITISDNHKQASSENQFRWTSPLRT
jgi:hypothetical protein